MMRARRRLRVLTASQRPVVRPTIVPLLAARAVLTTTLSGLAGAVLGLAMRGPVAAGLAGIYASLAATALVRYHRARCARDSSGRALDAIAGLAADLRAGTAPATALTAAMPAVQREPHMLGRLCAAWRIATLTGAPLADLLDRLEVDLRARLRLRQTVAAQAAGARATAWLLAGLPVAGLGVGAWMGADPLHVLMDTRLGAACATVSVVFQLAGLAWTARLVGAAGESR